jgi:carboxyl-terminal processing protease
MEEEAGVLTGIIIDLRGDPGGFLEQAVRVGDLFLADGEIVRTIGAGRRVRDTRKANRADRSEKIGLQTDLEKAPLVVLIDGASASASEIVAGALKNRGRGLIVGSKSFGKGTVQGIYDVGDGAVKITIAEYLTPGGVPVHELGVVPDVALRPIEIGKDELLVYGHLEDEREDSKAERKSRKRRGSKDKPRRVVRFVDIIEDPNDEEARDKRRFQYDEVERDLAIEVAEALLTEAGAPTADATFRNGGLAMDRIEQREIGRLGGALAKRGVNWSAGPAAARPRLEADFTSLPEAGLVQAGETMELSVRLRNTGVQTLHRVHAIATSTSRLFDGREFFFGKLEPGEQRSWVVKIEPDLSAYSRLDPVTVEFYQDGKKIGLKRKLILGVDQPARPSFEFTYVVDDAAKGNGDGRLQRGEEVTMRLRVRNRGGGDAKETVLALKNEAGESVFLKRGRHLEKEGVKAGAWYEAAFDFEVRPALTASTVPFGVLVRDNKHSTGIHQNVEVPVHDDTAVVGEPASGSVFAAADLDLLGGASTRFPVVAHIPRGTELQRIAQARTWVRVRVGEAAASQKGKHEGDAKEIGLVGWVRTSQLSGERAGAAPTAQATAAAAFRPPEIQIEAPAGPGRHVSGERAVVRGRVVFHRAGRAVERAVTVYVGGRKVWYDSRRHVDTEPLIIPIDLPVELDPGPNRITVRAIETDRIEVAETLFIHREEIEQ